MKTELPQLMKSFFSRLRRRSRGNPLLLYQERAQNAVRNFSRSYNFENRLSPSK